MVVEYFKKWVEGRPITNISSATFKKFFSQNIICRDKVPRHITFDNAKYFDSAVFKDFSHQVRMEVALASIYHPQSNEAVERASDLVFEAIKKILEGEEKTNGLKSNHWQYGVTTQQSLGQQILHHSGSCSELKRYYQKRSSTEAYEQQWRFHLALEKPKIKTY
jgi:hypothetical protein